MTHLLYRHSKGAPIPGTLHDQLKDLLEGAGGAKATLAMVLSCLPKQRVRPAHTIWWREDDSKQSPKRPLLCMSWRRDWRHQAVFRLCSKQSCRAVLYSHGHNATVPRWEIPDIVRARTNVTDTWWRHIVTHDLPYPRGEFH